MLRIALFLATNLAVIVLASITLSLLGVGSMLAENGVDLDLGNLLVICAVFGFGGSLFSLFISKFMARMSTRTQIIERPRTSDEQWLMQTVAELAEKAKIGMPEVGVFPSAQANAFATGWNRNNALVAVSAGLLQRFRRDEVRAVLAHEIGHVANGDMVTLTLLQGVINTFVMFFARIIGHTVDRTVFKNERGHGLGFYAVTIAAEVILGILASMIVMAFSRYREFRADAAGAHLADRTSMINALRRLKEESQAPQMPDTLTAFGINGNFHHQFSRLFASHPPLEDRIAALQGHSNR